MGVDESHFDGLSGLVRLTGATVPSRARFVGETLISSSLCSLTFGLVCGHVGSTSSIGPLVPFLIGSWTGYSFGLIHQWKDSKRRTLSYAQRYPKLLRHSLETEFDFAIPQDICLRSWILNGGLRRMTYSMLAAQSCKAAVDEIVQSQRQKIVEEESEDS